MPNSDVAAGPHDEKTKVRFVGAAAGVASGEHIFTWSDWQLPTS
jgi:hypothetical protein